MEYFNRLAVYDSLSLSLSFSSVPLRAPELSLTSRSPTDIQVSWLPLAPKLIRGRVSAYRLWYQAGSEEAATQLELPGDQTQHLLEGLQPDTVYLLRIAASTSMGWGEPCAWTSHRTPKTSSREGNASSSEMFTVLLINRAFQKQGVHLGCFLSG